MNEILPQKIGDYYMIVREFANDSIEVVVKTISPMYGGAVIDAANPMSYRNYCKENNLPTGLGGRGFHERQEVSEEKRKLNNQRSVRRSARAVRFLVKQIQADRLLTLSTRENIQDREQFKGYMKRFFRLVRSGWKGQGGVPDFVYVAVLEKQERGAFHAHLAIRGAINFNFLRTAWHKALGYPGLMRGEQSPGTINVTTPRSSRWGTEFSRWKANRLSSYLVKYMSKTFDDDLSEKHKYFNSKNIEKPKETKYILGATTMREAIGEVIDKLGFLYDYEITFEHAYNSPGGDSIWFSLGGK